MEIGRGAFRAAPAHPPARRFSRTVCACVSPRACQEVLCRLGGVQSVPSAERFKAEAGRDSGTSAPQIRGADPRVAIPHHFEGMPLPRRKVKSPYRPSQKKLESMDSERFLQSNSKVTLHEREFCHAAAAARGEIQTM